ncbi:ABC transporter ATP-binding protein [Thermodesulfobacterium hydrogeniphilum]|uniref:ABC transporter ATP-binding protein n=1 Tax=Thermodesulfobacterium hydrogeniphilum TaxID=161156 RepID=UPI0005702DCA|nr:ABC transporter ATP-binding protein [Thermodesulfobacterium hydrogeniphilum]
MKPILKVENVYKNFGSKIVLKNVSFELYPSDILGIIGPNGAGKSTLLYILLNIITPTSGKIFYFGKDFFKNRSEILKKVSFASQYVSLPYSLTVEENLKVFANLYEIKKADKKITELLDLFRLKDKKKVLTRALSSGEMMRLNLVRAFLNDPLILLLDEPTAGLDPEYVKYISELLKYLSKDKQLAIILTSHQLGELEKIINKALLIKNGITLAYGTLTELFKKFKVNSLEELYFKILT